MFSSTTTVHHEPDEVVYHISVDVIVDLERSIPNKTRVNVVDLHLRNVPNDETASLILDDVITSVKGRIGVPDERLKYGLWKTDRVYQR